MFRCLLRQKLVQVASCCGRLVSGLVLMLPPDPANPVVSCLNVGPVVGAVSVVRGLLCLFGLMLGATLLRESYLWDCPFVLPFPC